MFTPAAARRTFAWICSGVACPSVRTASSTIWRCAVSRSPRERSASASEDPDMRSIICRPRRPPARPRCLPAALGVAAATLAGMERVVAVLGRGVVPAETTILRADDLGALRGDGVFETMHVRPGGPWLIEEHLARMARSAARLDLALPDREDLAALAGEACAAWPAELEGSLRLICTRGPEDGGPVTCYATIAPIGPAVVQARHQGVRVATATLGFGTDTRGPSPWLLGGVKSLSYAVNMASLRWAQTQGCDDVLWLSGDDLWTLPTCTGILPGTTARYLLDHAAELGWHAGERLVRPAVLETADGVWLTSSVRGVTPVTELDGVKLAESRHTEQIRTLLGYPA